MDEPLELELTLTPELQKMANAVNGLLPDKWGFVILTFPFDHPDTPVLYVSNAERGENIYPVIENWLASMRAGDFRYPDRSELEPKSG